MGTTNHDAVIATTAMPEAWAAAEQTWLHGDHADRFAAGGPFVNGYRTLILLPDGSNEGWADSDHGDDLRQELIDWLREPRPHCWWDWVEVSWGEFGQAVTRGNNRDLFCGDEPFHQPERIKAPDVFDEEADVWIIS